MPSTLLMTKVRTQSRADDIVVDGAGALVRRQPDLGVVQHPPAPPTPDVNVRALQAP